MDSENGVQGLGSICRSTVGKRFKFQISRSNCSWGESVSVEVSKGSFGTPSSESPCNPVQEAGLCLRVSVAAATSLGCASSCRDHRQRMNRSQPDKGLKAHKAFLLWLFFHEQRGTFEQDRDTERTSAAWTHKLHTGQRKQPRRASTPDQVVSLRPLGGAAEETGEDKEHGEDIEQRQLNDFMFEVFMQPASTLNDSK
ncbi:unnamed protein product [Pleuronectes platessa]|uniref:Uncharacterized protein n=1 Tax=Pleuronectes platessa TaxID=8262 RepID=A0A9N7YI12_PLEPL|nr:unnamed protein product [Pleuronectes platessa]